MQAFPLVYALLTGKEEMLYDRLFAIVDHLALAGRPAHFSPPAFTLISDYEKGIQAAFTKRYVGSRHELLGCFFHYSQAIYRAVVRLGMQTEYRSNERFRGHVRMFIALGLVPLEWVDAYIGHLHALIASNDPLCLRLYNEYFHGQWVVRTPRKLWNWFGRADRTNNQIEAHHSRLAKKFPAAHPTTYRFALVLLDYHNMNVRDMMARKLGGAGPAVGRKRVQTQNRLAALESSFHSQAPLDYLWNVAHATPQPHLKDCRQLLPAAQLLPADQLMPAAATAE